MLCPRESRLAQFAPATALGLNMHNNYWIATSPSVALRRSLRFVKFGC